MIWPDYVNIERKKKSKASVIFSKIMWGALALIIIWQILLWLKTGERELDAETIQEISEQIEIIENNYEEVQEIYNDWENN